jgi:hypothetical protein
MKNFFLTLSICVGLAVAAALPAKAQTYGYSGPAFTTNAGLAGGYSGATNALTAGALIPAAGSSAGTFYPTNAAGLPFIFPLGTPNKYNKVTIDVRYQLASNATYTTFLAGTPTVKVVFGANLDGNPTNFVTNYCAFLTTLNTNGATTLPGLITENFTNLESYGMGYLILDHFENLNSNPVVPIVNIGTKPGF